MLRQIDTALDLAFLAMDVMRRDRGLAAALVDGYREAGGDPGDDVLVAFFAAQRALIRAKVALIRAGQVDGADRARRRADAAALLALADRLGWEIRLGRLAVICGPAHRARRRWPPRWPHDPARASCHRTACASAF